MLILRKVLFGFIWFIVIYLLACAVIGAIAGGMAGASHPDNAGAAGHAAAQEVIITYVRYILAGSVLAAVLGSAFGVLPGTGRRKKK